MTQLDWSTGVNRTKLYLVAPVRCGGTKALIYTSISILLENGITAETGEYQLQIQCSLNYPNPHYPNIMHYSKLSAGPEFLPYYFNVCNFPAMQNIT